VNVEFQYYFIIAVLLEAHITDARSRCEI